MSRARGGAPASPRAATSCGTCGPSGRRRRVSTGIVAARRPNHEHGSWSLALGSRYPHSMSSDPKRFESLETKAYAVTRLLDAVSTGRVRLPRFQRGFRWSDDDRLQLFDSILRGYPIGTLLLAQGRAPADRVVLGGYATDVPEAPDALWVVDGQQRVATLATALLRDHDGVHRPIYFDLDAEEFVLGRRRTAAKPLWVPTRALARSAELNKWLREAGASDEHCQRADRVAERIREYAVPAYLVPFDGENDATLKEIFRRVNRRGRMLESFEVFEAMRTSMDGTTRPLQRVTADLVSLGFGKVEGKSIERAALAVGGLDPGRELDEQLDAGAERALLDRVTRGLAGAIQFLAEDVGCVHHSLLPYEGPLFTLARFFAMHPAPHPRSRELLARWFWRGTISGVHRTDYSSDRRNWQAIAEGDEHGSVQRLLRGLAPMTVDYEPYRLEAFRRHHARSRVELMALAALGPLLVHGEDAGRRVPIAVLLEAERPLIPWHVDSRKGATVAGMLLHPSIELREGTSASEALLRSHLLDPESWRLLCAGDTSAAVDRRTPAVLDHVRRFVQERLALDQPERDRPPAEGYLAEDGA